MSLKVQVSEVIDRRVSDVWHFYAVDHVRNHPRWDPDMQLEKVTIGPIGVGTIIRRTNTHSGTPVEGTMEVVEFEPNQAMGVVIHDGPSETHGRVTFEPVSPGQTMITINAEFVGMDESMADKITPLVERSARNIKQLIESEV
jgi:glucokinase